MKYAIFLSVRDKATRLPAKVRRLIKGKMVIEHLIDRIKCSKKNDLIIMTTSTNPGDDGLVDIARNTGIECFRGSEEDKLKRYLDAAKKYQVEFAVVVDGDDIFCDPDAIDRIIASYDENKADYIIVDKLPVGVTGFGIKIDALEKVIQLKKEDDTEVWGKYFTENSIFKVIELKPQSELERPHYRLTLDYEEDLRLFEIIYDRLFDGLNPIDIKSIVRLLDDNEEYASMNLSAAKRYEEKIRESQNKIDTSKFV